jgi:hypothetical protein
MPGIISGTNKIKKRYKKLVAPKYLALQQNIIEKIKNINNTAECSQNTYIKRPNSIVIS